MSEYFNQLNVNIAEVATLTFNHTINSEVIETVAEVVTMVDNLKNIHMFLGEVLKKHDENLAAQKEANKKLM